MGAPPELHPRLAQRREEAQLAMSSALGGAPVSVSATHDPDYFMKKFSVKTFDATGRLKSEVTGADATTIQSTTHTRRTSFR